MLDFIKLYPGILVSWIFVYLSNSVLFRNKSGLSIKSVIIIAICATTTVILNMVNSEVLSGIIKIMISYMMFCVFNKIVFDVNWQETIGGSLI